MESRRKEFLALVKGVEAEKRIVTACGKPDIAKCVGYLSEEVARTDALLAEKVSGIVSLSLKAYLLREMIQAKSGEEKLKSECGAFSAGLLLEVARGVRN